jgi:hypothetical protein
MTVSPAEQSYRDHHEHHMRLMQQRQVDHRLRDHREYLQELEATRIERARRMDLDQGRHVDRYA